MSARNIETIGRRLCHCNQPCGKVDGKPVFSPKGHGVFPWNAQLDNQDGVYTEAFSCSQAPTQDGSPLPRICTEYTPLPILVLGEGVYSKE